MAPEQAKGVADIDRRADIFAMGTVLWEVLACKRLFKGDGDADTLNKVLHEPIPALRSVAPAMPVALDTICAKALDRDRSKRFANAAEFADALERTARVVGMLGAHRDVAAHVDSAIGTEISQQRDAVRAWLARSEPSSQGIVGPTSASMRRDNAISTRVDSSPRRSEVSQPSSVSGVSSAVGEPLLVSSSSVPIMTPIAPPASAPPVLAPQRASRGWMAVALLLILGGAGFVANKRWPALLAPPAAATPPPTVAPPVSSPATPVSAAAVVAPHSAVASATSSTAAAPTASESAAPHRKAAQAPGPFMRPNPPPAAPTAAVPDDISRNPYR
jgi:hypothetical protein